MEESGYLKTGTALGVLTAIIWFIGAWWYCAAHYGFLLGFGLGWLPAGISATMAGFAMRYLWGIAAFLLALAALGLIGELLGWIS